MAITQESDYQLTIVKGQMMGLDQIFNYIEVNPWIGTAGMPKVEQLQDIHDGGYGLVIYLALQDSPGAIPDEGDRVRTFGMDYLHIPVLWEKPLQTDLDTFLEAMQSAGDRKVFVHCVKNMRATAFTFIYLVLVRETPVEEAKKLVAKIWKPDGIWQDFIQTALHRYNKTDGFINW